MIFGIPAMVVLAYVSIANITISAALGIAAFFFRNTFTGRADFEAACARITELETAKQIAAAMTGVIADAAHSKEDIARLELEALAIEAGQEVFDKHLQSLATKEDVAEINITLAKQNGARTTLSAKVDGIEEQLRQLRVPIDTIYKHLLAGSLK